jgi:hypothetical protein
MRNQVTMRAFPPLFMTGFEYIWLIKEIGVNVREFAEHIHRSQNFIRQCLGYRRIKSVPIRWVVALRDYVGQEVFEAGLFRIRTKRENEWYYEELREHLGQ